MNFKVKPDLTEKIHTDGSAGGWNYPKYYTIQFADDTTAKYEFVTKDVTKLSKELAIKFPCGATASDGKTNIGKKLIKKYGGQTPEAPFPFYSNGTANYAIVDDYLIAYCKLDRFKVSAYYKKI
ncbi:MAG: hypothetical protein K2G77_07140 [Muribaculaceae bacterium]|nr:hypothetical protein [Muribaculaceae bacterium]